MENQTQNSSSNYPQHLIEELFEKGILISQDFLDKNNSIIEDSLIQKISQENDLMVINQDYAEIISQESSLIDWYEIDGYRVEAEKSSQEDFYHHQINQLKKVSSSGDHSFQSSKLTPLLSSPEVNSHLTSEIDKKNNLETNDFETALSTPFTETREPVLSASSQISSLTSSSLILSSSTSISPADPIIFSGPNNVEILISYENKPKKYEVHDFTNFFISRYRFLESLLRNRQELKNVLTINRLMGKKERELVSIIGVIEEISITKNENYLLTFEDLTGKVKVLLSKNNPELFNSAKELTVDEVIGIVGYPSEKMFFGEKVIWPDIPSTNEMKKSQAEEYAVFLSDVHVGSKMFLKEEFEKFIRWVNGEMGSDEQKESAKKVKYIFIAGDIVDGIGIYPSQEEELEIKDIFQQYEEFTKLISQISPDKQIIICPGNHDCIHLAEPQPVFYKEYASSLFRMPNVTLVTNPGMVNIGKTKTFSGFDVLLYHGYSFDYYIANVEAIRNNGGYQRADLIMKLLLKKRHLAPSFKSTPYLPVHKEDPMLIKKIPDFLITGHIHYSKVANYKGITMISGSCWQAKTSFQEKLGHEPEPGRVPLVNLKTREIKILKFV